MMASKVQKMWILFPQVEFCLLVSKHAGVFNFEGDNRTNLLCNVFSCILMDQ